jgi:hypothetical protein
MIAMACAAADLGWFAVHYGNHIMVHHALTAHAKIVDIVA